MRHAKIEQIESSINELEQETLESIWKPEVAEPELWKLIKKMFREAQQDGGGYDRFMSNLLLPDKLVNEYKVQ